MQVCFYILLVFVLVNSKTPEKDFEEKRNGHTTIWKESLIDLMRSKKDDRGICFGLCVTDGQCVERSGGIDNCQCKRFRCQLLTKVVLK